MSQSGERTVVVEGPPPPRTSRSLERALRVVDAGPVWLYRAALASLVATCVLAIGIALYVRPAGHLLRPQKEIILLGLLGLFAVGVLILIAVIWPARRRAAFLDRLVAPDQRAAIWLALAGRVSVPAHRRLLPVQGDAAVADRVDLVRVHGQALGDGHLPAGRARADAGGCRRGPRAGGRAGPPAELARLVP